jgi:hypothetical protein
MRGALAAALRAPWLRDPLWTRARMVPSLDLRMEDALLRASVSGQRLVTFTRASTGTYVGSDGLIKTAAVDEPRISHDLTTGQRLGLLVEESRTNSAQWSEAFNNPVWLVTGSGATITATADVAAPDGTMTAWTLTSSGAAAQIQQVSAGTSGITYTGSFYIRRRSGVGDVNIRVSENVNTPLVGVTTSWQRFSFAATSTSTAIRIGVKLSGLEDAVDIWCAQLEVGSTASSYIGPTLDTAVTRAADIAAITSGLDASRIRTLYVEFASPASGARGIVSLNDNSANNRFGLSTSGTDPLAVAVTGGVSQASIDAGTVTANQISKLAARFSADDFAASFNGGAEVIDTSGTMPTVDRIMLGRSQANEYLNGPITRLVGWDRPVYNLQELTR